MIEFKTFYFLPLLIIYALFTWFFYRKRETTFLKQLVNLTFFIYIMLVISITFFPIIIDKRLILNMIQTNTEAKNNFIPFATISNELSQIRDHMEPVIKQLMGNILLALPLGFYAPLMHFQFRKFKFTFLLGLFFGIGIESLQFLVSLIVGMNYRSVDIDDVILNTVGVICGYLILQLCIPLLIRILNVLDSNSEKNIKFLNLWR